MPADNKAYAQREKAYLSGTLYPEIRVGMMKVNLTPTVTKDENGVPHMEPNEPVYIYDTSGPYSDPEYQVDLKQGLPRMREKWIIERNDTEELGCVSSDYGRQRLEDHRWTVSVSAISNCLAGQLRARISLRWHTRKPESSLRKWSMLPFERT